MKRSEINETIQRAEQFIKARGFHLPGFAHWNPEDWIKNRHAIDEIRTSQLGWDVTDFGLGSFAEKGVLLFTIRNGSPAAQTGIATGAAPHGPRRQHPGRHRGNRPAHGP